MENKLNNTLMNIMGKLLLGLMLVFAAPPVWTETITYYHNDALGSPIAATDENGKILWKEDYHPYGSRIRKQNTGTNQQWYTGKHHENDIGLTYFGARWYDPAIGRFMAIDPVGFREKNVHSFNRYSYVNNNPYKYVDPDGRLETHAQDDAFEGNGNAGGPGFTSEVAAKYLLLISSNPAGLASLGQTLVRSAATKLSGNITKGIDDVISSASRPARAGSKDSRALQALKKKVDRGDNAFSGLPKTQDTANNLIRQTLGAKNPVIRTKTQNGQTVRDVFDQSTARGVRTIDGQFDTFVNLNK